MAGTLYIVATPIGNLEDMPPRVAATFGAADFIAAEDTRVTMKLLNFLGLKKPMVSYYEHALQKGEGILRRIEAGENCALCSDAGMPCVSDPGRTAPYTDAGCRVWTLPGRGEHVDLPALMDALGAAEIDGVLLEGGGTLNWAMLEAGLVQRVQAYIAPKLLGGAGARSPVEGRGVEAPDQAAHLRKVTVTALGEDFLLEGEVDRDVYGTH